MDFAVIFDILYTESWSNFHPNTIHYGFWSNFHHNTIGYGFWSKFRHNTIH